MARLEKITIEWLDINEIHPYAGNANMHPDNQIKAIARSIEEFGITKPLLIDANNVLITGHGTHAAAIVVGLKKVPCVRRADWSDRQVAAYRLADNQLAKKSKYDFELLAEEVSNLIDFDFDVSVLGFDEQELESLLTDNLSIMPTKKILPETPPFDFKPSEKTTTSNSVKAKIVREINCPNCGHHFEG